MKTHLQNFLQAAIDELVRRQVVPADLNIAIPLERSRDRQHGDYASSVALSLAKAAKLKPRELAEQLVAALPQAAMIAKVEIAGPGFINFFLTNDVFYPVLQDALTQGTQFGRSEAGENKKVLVEFVSANPTGPLHVGHGRGAAFGAALADLLSAVGFQVQREYYINDAGRQMHILAASVWLRYLALTSPEFKACDYFPKNAYRGDYVLAIAEELQQTYSTQFVRPLAAILTDLPLDETEDGNGDKEAHIDAVIERTKELLGHASYQLIFDHGLTVILNDIRNDLAEFGVLHDNWFSERSLLTSGAVENSIEALKQSGHTYTREGALWFRSTDFGDDKDRVLYRENGQPTYFASDVAYHFNKFERKIDIAIDVLGADHHGYVERIRASLAALGIDPKSLLVFLVQFAVLYRGAQKVQMSTRSGSFVTLRELRQEVGNDAARFFYVMRKNDQHMDFDLDLAKSKSNDNPVYYIQYAHARICSVVRQLQEKQMTFDQAQGLSELKQLQEEHEKVLLADVARYPETIQLAAFGHAPHLLATFLREVATDFHTYYNAHLFLVEEASTRNARLCLVLAVKQVLANGLELLGVSAPMSM